LSQSTGFFATFGAGVAVGFGVGDEGAGLDVATLELPAGEVVAGELTVGAAAFGVEFDELAEFLALGVGLSSWFETREPLNAINPTRPVITNKATTPRTQGSFDPELAGAATITG